MPTDDIRKALDAHDQADGAQAADLARVTAERDAALADDAADEARIAELEAQVKALTPAVVLYRDDTGSRATLPAGKRGGGAGVNRAYALAKPVEAATLTYEVKFEAPFDWALGGKLPGLVGVAPGTSPTFPTGGKPDPDNLGWSGRLMWLQPAAGSWRLADGTRRRAVTPAEIVGYLYHPARTDQYGDNVWTGYAPPVGEWITVEIHHEINTVGQADGVLRISLGGKVLVDRNDYVYRTRDDVRITHYLDARFAGGATAAYTSTNDRHISVRNVLVTTAG